FVIGFVGHKQCKIFLISGFYLNGFGVAPQTFYIVIFSDMFLENVYYYIYIIHKYPFGIVCTFNMPGFFFDGFANGFFNGVDYRIYLCVGGSATDNKVITDSIFDFSQVQYLDINALNIFNSLYYFTD